jgi:peroxiredoxin Q/BCP
MLKEGSKVSAFSTVDEKGTKVSSKDLKGQKYIIFFYPKDNTPGCTKEACSIRDDYSAFKKLKIPVFGVSKDSTASHIKFKEKFKLPFPLLMDEEGDLIKSFGAWGEKSMYGKKYMGILRSTFIVNEKGIVEKVFPKVKVAEHAQEILEYLNHN